MGQKKIIRFAELLSFPNVFQYPKDMQGQWKSYFKNDNPITLELACGKGEYAVGLGRFFADRNFIGIDLKGNRIWVGAKKAIQENLQNVAFIRSHIDKLCEYFSHQEISEIWLPFPDPQLRGSKAKKRLTHPKFLRIYQMILQPKGPIHLKTDSPDLYNFTKQVIRLYNLPLEEDTGNVDQPGVVHEALMIKTHYENLDIAKSKKFYYLRFTLPSETLPDRDNELKDILSEEYADRRD